MNTVNFCIIYLILINFCHFPNICLTSVSCSPLLRTKRKRDTIVCVQRCDRIFERSLRRIDESRETLQNLLDKQRPKQKANDACWKSFDYLDCMQHCEVSDRHQLTKTARLIKSRCRSFVKGHEAELMCISRFHSFVEIRCSAYLHEAIRLSKLGIKRKHETCRDYFLSFILPDDDQYFSDDFLDDCQIYEFVNVNEQSMSTTEATQQDSPSSYSYAYEVSQVTHPDKLLDDVAYITTTTPPAPSTLNVGVLTTTETDATAVAIETKTDAGTTKKLLFSPDRDLEFTPPNFFYSSQRSPLPVQTTTTRTAVDYHPSHDSSQENHLDLVTLPMSIITHQVTADNSYENDGDERSQAVTYPSATLERHSNLQSIGKATHIEVSSSPRATTQQVHEWSESSVGSTRLITALSNDEFEDPSENSHQTKSYDDVQHPRHHPDHSGTASTTHRTSADQIEDEQRFASVIAVTPHRATIKPVGDFYTDLNYDSSEEEGGDVQTSKTTTQIQMSTYDASEVPSKSIYTPILPHVHHSTSVIDDSSLATNQLVEHLYEHQPDAELLTPTVIAFC
ncbi:unnamed protein product [Anisakis simplex]|uniref:Apple domain-containing protein n=1 Tax=Anisakis simplex TaxID=6269 RepID=A0A158PND4_ANISI|nr:unnamed protein product [Anisakis simplex]